MDVGTEVFVVDDDADVRDALAVMFMHAGYRATGFADGSAFLDALRVRMPACVILDVNMPGRSGIDILKELDAHHCGAPILMISAEGDIPLAVDAIKKGAYDFIQKPFDLDAVVARVRSAIAGFRQQSQNGNGKFRGHELLTPREQEVLSQIAGGASNKEAGRRLGISPRTVEVHRARIMEKLGARNAADLVRIVLSEAAVP